jgi:hypothetical protein
MHDDNYRQHSALDSLPFLLNFQQLEEHKNLSEQREKNQSCSLPVGKPKLIFG